MADNVAVTAGAGTTVATDDVAGVHFQKIKVDAGGDGASVPVIAGRQAAAASVPVVVANEDKTIFGAVDETAPVTDTASSGLNGRLQRIAQRITDLLASIGITTGAAVVTDADGTVQQYLRGIVKLLVTSGTIVLGAGTAAIGKLAANSGVDIGDVDVTSMPTGASAAQVQGTVAHDSAAAQNPLPLGGYAVSSEPAAVANADVARLLTDLVGKLIVLPYANPENFVSGAITSAMTGTTSTSLVASPGAGLRNYITTIIVSNAHATVGTDIIIQDGSGGTTLLTIPAAAVYGGAVITLPTPLRQPTTNTALYCANVTTGASTKVSAVGYKGA